MSTDSHQSPAARQRRPVGDTVIATAAALILLLVGYLLGDIKAVNVAAAVGVVVAIAGAAGLASFLVTQNVALATRRSADEVVLDVQDRIFSVLANFSGSESIGPSNDNHTFSVITAHQTGEMERNAREVWIYAYDLRWDYEETAFENVVHANLLHGKRYRYLVPPDSATVSRAKDLLCRFREVPDIQSLMEFRVRTEEAPFAQFGISIYNPTYMKTLSERTKTAAGAVVMFPHFGSAHSDSEPFLKITGNYAIEYERKFVTLWDEAKLIDSAEVFAHRAD
jgi:hypothetical protein